MDSNTPRFLVRTLVATLVISAIIVGLAPFLSVAKTPPALKPIYTAIQGIPAADSMNRWILTHLKHTPRKSEVARTTPAPRPATPQTLNQPQWGIVETRDTSTYSLAGEFLKRIEAGTIVTIAGFKESKSGRMVVVSPWPSRAAQTFLVPAANLAILDGRPTDLTSEARILRADHARLRAELKQALKPSPNAERSDNPHLAEYKQARRVYDEYWRRAKALEKERSNGTETERMRAVDELRSMKGEDIRIGKAYEAARDRYKEWNLAHPGNQTPAQNPRVRDLTERISRIEEQLEVLGATL